MRARQGADAAGTSRVVALLKPDYSHKYRSLCHYWLFDVKRCSSAAVREPEPFLS